MRDFQDKVAVVTGGSGGIGRGLAQRFLQAGMRVALADIDADGLKEAEQALGAYGTVIGIPTDVSKRESVEALARRVLDEFGAVHVVCNNAGLNSLHEPALWELPHEEWQTVVGVNFWGVLNGMHVFVPLMIEQDTEGHIVNTASAAGLGSRPGISTYVATKAAVVALSESLHHELAKAGSKLRASVLCPGRVRTAVRMGGYQRPRRARSEDEGDGEGRRMLPTDVGDLVVEAIREERFYILTHPEAIKERVRSRADDLLLDRLPTYSPSIRSD